MKICYLKLVLLIGLWSLTQKLVLDKVSITFGFEFRYKYACSCFLCWLFDKVSSFVEFVNSMLFVGYLMLMGSDSILQYTSIKPLGDRVLVKIKTVEEKTGGGILLPTTAQTKPQGGEVVAVGEGKTIGKTKVGISVEVGDVFRMVLFSYSQ